MATKTRRRRPLTKQRVLEKAIAVADKDGIDALSMRKLGQALGVEAMSLYKHVANKGELVAAMVDSVLEQFELPDDEPAWDVAIRRCAICAHDLLIEHPWACGLAIVPGDVRTISGPRIRYMEWLLRRLREAGFSGSHVLRLPHDRQPHLRLHALADRARQRGPGLHGSRRGVGRGVRRPHPRTDAAELSVPRRARGAAHGPGCAERQAGVRVRPRLDPRRPEASAPRRARRSGRARRDRGGRRPPPRGSTRRPAIPHGGGRSPR
jgi:Transcriptional regulator